MSGDKELAPYPERSSSADAAELPVKLLALSRPAQRTLEKLRISTLGELLEFDLSNLRLHHLPPSEIARLRGELMPFKFDLGLNKQRAEAQLTSKIIAGGSESDLLASVTPDLGRFKYTHQVSDDWEQLGSFPNLVQLPPGHYFLFASSTEAEKFRSTLVPVRDHYLGGEDARNALVASGEKDGCYSVYVSQPLMTRLEPILKVARTGRILPDESHSR